MQWIILYDDLNIYCVWHASCDLGNEWPIVTHGNIIRVRVELRSIIIVIMKLICVQILMQKFNTNFRMSEYIFISNRKFISF